MSAGLGRRTPGRVRVAPLPGAPALVAVLLVVAVLGGGCAGRRRGPVVAPPASSAPVSAPTADADTPADGLRPPMPTPADTLTPADEPGLRSDEPVFLAIGLATGKPRVELTVEGATELIGGGDSRVLARLPAGAACVLEAGRGGVSWRGGGRDGVAAAPLRLRPVDPRHGLVWGDTPYGGEMRILRPQSGLTLINVVALEEYLRGVVPWEIGRPGEPGLAALEAQAVAARTYSLAHRGDRSGLGFDLWADVQDQVYHGRRGNDPWCDRAVDNTRGLVLRHGGREIEAYYCSTCGGRTSDVHEVWPREPRPYLTSVADGPSEESWCRGSPLFRWEKSWSAADLERVLQRTLPEYLQWLSASPARRDWAGEGFAPARAGVDARRPGRLRGLEIAGRTSCGRVARLDVRTDAGVYRIRGDRVRWVLAPVDGRFSILESASFDLSVESGRDGGLRRVTVAGRGFGHGVGLCQHGALAMARAGHGVREILAHYYPGARLEAIGAP